MLHFNHFLTNSWYIKLDIYDPSAKEFSDNCGDSFWENTKWNDAIGVFRPSEPLKLETWGLCQTSWWDQMFVVNSQTGVAVNFPELTFQEWPQCSVPWFIEICYGARVSLVDSLTENHAATYNMRKRCQVYGDTFCSSCRYVRRFLTGDGTVKIFSGDWAFWYKCSVFRRIHILQACGWYRQSTSQLENFLGSHDKSCMNYLNTVVLLTHNYHCRDLKDMKNSAQNGALYDMKSAPWMSS